MTAPFAFRVSDAVLGTFGFRIVLVQREDDGVLFPIKSVPFYSHPSLLHTFRCQITLRHYDLRCWAS